jgi:hypothetical protein
MREWAVASPGPSPGRGARIFLVGRTRPLKALAADSTAAYGSAKVPEVDALDERAVDEHARTVTSRAGRINVSFNLVSRGVVQDVPLDDVTAADLARPVTTGLMAKLPHRT